MVMVKFVLFAILELSVIVAIGTVFIAGIYQVVQDSVNDIRKQDEIVGDLYTK